MDFLAFIVTATTWDPYHEHLFQVFQLTEDYDKAIIPYQTKEIALNVTAEINLRSFKLQKHTGKPYVLFLDVFS